jgi:hypothetical protein
MSKADDLYAFVFKGDLAQDAVNREISEYTTNPEGDNKLIAKMPIDLLNEDFVSSAQKMASIYIAIAAFENSARKFIQDRLLEKAGANWWIDNVPNSIKERAERLKKEEEQIRWHGSRGRSLIFYTQIDDLVSIMQNNFVHFEDYIPSVEWARQIFKSLERSRNVIMHSGELSMNDVERVAMNIRDWIRQVGG